MGSPVSTGIGTNCDIGGGPPIPRVCASLFEPADLPRAPVALGVGRDPPLPEVPEGMGKSFSTVQCGQAARTAVAPGAVGTITSALPPQTPQRIRIVRGTAAELAEGRLPPLALAVDRLPP